MYQVFHGSIVSNHKVFKKQKQKQKQQSTINKETKQKQLILTIRTMATSPPLGTMYVGKLELLHIELQVLTTTGQLETHVIDEQVPGYAKGSALAREIRRRYPNNDFVITTCTPDCQVLDLSRETLSNPDDFEGSIRFREGAVSSSCTNPCNPHGITNLRCTLYRTLCAEAPPMWEQDGLLFLLPDKDANPDRQYLSEGGSQSALGTAFRTTCGSAIC